MRALDPVPSPRPLSPPPVSADALAETDADLAAAVAAWQEAVAAYREAVRRYRAVLPASPLGDSGAELATCVEAMRSHVADGARDLDQLSVELALLMADRPRRLARAYAAAAICDHVGDVVVEAAKAARPLFVTAAKALEARALAALAGLADLGDPAEALTAAQVRAGLEPWAECAQVAEGCADPRSPRRPGHYELPPVVDARLRELTNKPPLEPAGGSLVVEGSSDFESAAARALGVYQPRRMVAQRPGRR